MGTTNKDEPKSLAKFFGEMQHLHSMAGELLEETDDLATRWFAGRVLDFTEAGIAEMAAAGETNVPELN